jgi:hypothetical protein
MATVRDPVKPEPVAKYETLVETRLAQARGRIRALDLTAAFLGFLIATMAFGLIMVLLDRWLHLSTPVRQIALCIYGIAALAYLGRTAAWPLLRRVNPYYAALQVEHSLPAAKNSVVNWLDLRQQQLAPAIRGAVSHRAALDMARADMDEAINPRQVLRLGGGAVGLFVILLAVALFGPGLGRVFQPFSASNQTEIIIVKPEGGNATVSVGSAASFEVSVRGRRPDSLRFLFRYQQTDPYVERTMDPGETRQWLLTIQNFEVYNGFWYKVAGGDAETEEYRVNVRATPLITGFEATYHHRPYTHLPDISSDDPNLKGLRGTEVQLVARTNRKIRFGPQSGLMFPELPEKSLVAEPARGDPQAMQFRLVLDKDATYQISFISDEGESNTPIFYSIKVQPDNAPVVVLTKPEQEMISLPANGVLSLEGSATDDFGITGFTLRMQTKPKNSSPSEPLPAKPYRPGKSFKLADDSSPAQLDYKDFVELNKVANGQPLKPGTIVEYWLEAIDNCDFPAPNIGRSRSKYLTITEPAKDQQHLDKQKKQSKEDQKKHETQQDQELQKQGQENKDQPQPENNSQANEGAKPDQEKKLQDTGNKLAQQLKKEEAAKEGKAEGEQPQAKPDPNGKGQPDNKALKEEPLPMPRPDEKGDNGQQPKDGQPGAENGPPDQKPAKENAKQPNGMKDETKGAKPNDAQAAAKQGPPGEKQKQGDDKQAKNDKAGAQQGPAKPPQKPGDKPPDDQVKKAENKNKLKPKEDPKGGEKEQKEPRVNNPANAKGEDKASNKAPKKDSEGERGNPQGAAEANKDQNQPKIDKNPGKGTKGSEAKKPGDKPPKEETDPANAPNKPPQNPMPDKNANPPAKPENPKDGKGQEKGGKPMDKPGAKNDQNKPDNKQNQKPGQGADNKEGQAKKEIDNLAKAMKSADPKARQEAQKKLEDLSKNAKQPADRQAAADALKKASKENSDADAKNAQNNQEGDGKKDGKEAGSGQNKAAQKGQLPSKEKPGDTADNNDQNQQDGQPGQKGKEGEGKGEPKKGAAKGQAGEQPNKPGNNSGGNNQSAKYNPAGQGSSPEAEKGSNPNEQFLKKAGVLQLEEAKKRLKELKDKANDEFLKNAKVSKEDLQEYIKYEEERLRRLEARLKQDDKLRDPKRSGGSLSNLRARKVNSGEKQDDLPHANQADAPPELREANREFTQLLAKPSKDKK